MFHLIFTSWHYFNFSCNIESYILETASNLPWSRQRWTESSLWNLDALPLHNLDCLDCSSSALLGLWRLESGFKHRLCNPFSFTMSLLAPDLLGSPLWLKCINNWTFLKISALCWMFQRNHMCYINKAEFQNRSWRNSLHENKPHPVFWSYICLHVLLWLKFTEIQKFPFTSKQQLIYSKFTLLCRKKSPKVSAYIFRELWDNSKNLAKEIGISRLLWKLQMCPFSPAVRNSTLTNIYNCEIL